MVTIFVLAVCFSLAVSFMCSLAEATLYGIPLFHVKHLAESGSRSGALLLKLKEDIGRPIAAILALNTMAHTVGATVAGAEAVLLWGQAGLTTFSIIYTIAVLLLTEILPKIIGITYCRELGPLMAPPLALIIRALSPFIWVTERITKRFQGDEDEPTVSEEEVVSMATIGTEEGTLDELQGSVITNVIGLDQILVRDVQTPRVSVFRLIDSTKIEDLREVILGWDYTRIPIYSQQEPDTLHSYVMQRDIYRAMVSGKGEQTLKELARPLRTVPELMSVGKLLRYMFEKKESICAVVDEHGGLAGVVTLEDVIEEMVGQEIVDEYD